MNQTDQIFDKYQKELEENFKRYHTNVERAVNRAMNKTIFAMCGLSLAVLWLFS